jgi:hypothetical protein
MALSSTRGYVVRLFKIEQTVLFLLVTFTPQSLARIGTNVVSTGVHRTYEARF